ncbi:MAG: type II toxin-antitoxin system VapC family toxin [Gammaproteobacteria bacterium]
MKLLLDTHALLWWLFDDPALSVRARELIADRANTVYVSAASAWEIAIKWRLGRLPDAEEAVRRLPRLVEAAGFMMLPIALEHTLTAGTLDSPLRDPFDRMLVAQCLGEGMLLISRNEAITSAFSDVRW